MNEANNDWAARIEAAAKILSMTPADLTDVLGKPTGLGITSLEMLDSEDFKFGDLFEEFKIAPFVVKGKVPVRMAFSALKGGQAMKTETANTGSGSGEISARTELLKSLGLKVRIEDADPAALLPHYLPNKPNDPITTALRKRFAEKRVIAFRDDGTVAINETVSYISDLEQGFPDRPAIDVDGKLARLWPVGVKPDEMVDEDPLFPGQPLRENRSIVNHRNWGSVSKPNRQLCRIIVQRGEIDLNNREAVLRLLERANRDNETQLSEIYPEAALEFRERQKRDELPKLKVHLGALTEKPNNPFGVSRRY